MNVLILSKSELSEFFWFLVSSYRDLSKFKVESWRCYDLTIELLRSKERMECVRHISHLQVLKEVERRFIKTVGKRLSDRCKEMTDYQAIQHKKLKSGNVFVDNENGEYISKKQDDGVSSDEDVGEAIDLDAEQSRLRRRHLDDAEYEGEEDEKKVVQDDSVEDDSDSEEENADSQNQDGSDEYERVTIQKSEEPISHRIQSVIASSSIIRDYKFDQKNNRWCVITFQFPLSIKTKLDVRAVVERELENFLIWETPGIEKCIIRSENNKYGENQVLATQGINLQALMKHSDALDVNTLYSNDLDLICRNYGIEACNRALVKEIVRVFKPYGIDVNQRHLTLTADYMTFTGRIQPFTRGAMGFSTSPLQQMTFETTVAFMRDALINGSHFVCIDSSFFDTFRHDDYLASPSSRLVIGGLLRSGTGIFDLMSSRIQL
ncbi:unnamed protein product [Thelazia callipaeda]|uniref:DNA-directed RNA polymerase n=1 Tax=Thelazia callipaeda TaxID=103827 RepID=A0A0N5CR05_THECL|nr:unnamed protein product [Thelazia callipaeda]